MKLEGIRKLESGEFITRYDLDYETVDGKPKVYEMISRDPDMKTEEDLLNDDVAAVVLILTDESGERLLLNREFRMATGRKVFNFPAGLIEPGEEPEKAAARELMEETGLTLVSGKMLAMPSYSSIGFSNERNYYIMGKCRGEIRPSDSVFEEIDAGFYLKEDLRRLLETEYFSNAPRLFCYLWCGGKFPL